MFEQKNQKQVKQNRDYNLDCWKCHQLWQSKFGEENCTFATVKKYVRIQNYSNIKKDIIINYQPTERRNGDANNFSLRRIKKKNTHTQEQVRPTDPPSGHLESIKNAPTPPLAHKTTTLLQNPDMIIHEIVATKINEMVETVR